MQPTTVGILLLLGAGLSCISLCIFMMHWEGKNRRDRICGDNDRSIFAGKPMGTTVPAIKETQT